jgi:gas vesicle protein
MQSNNGFGYFFLGVSVGAAAALLLAPKTGADTRNYLQSRAEDAAQQIKQQANRVMDRANEKIARGKTTVRDQVNNLSAAVDAGKRAYHTAVES